LKEELFFFSPLKLKKYLIKKLPFDIKILNQKVKEKHFISINEV